MTSERRPVRKSMNSTRAGLAADEDNIVQQVFKLEGFARVDRGIADVRHEMQMLRRPADVQHLRQLGRISRQEEMVDQINAFFKSARFTKKRGKASTHHMPMRALGNRRQNSLKVWLLTNSLCPSKSRSGSN